MMNTATSAEKAKDARLGKLKRALDEAQASLTPQVESMFAEAYELVEQFIATGTPQKTIIDKINSIYGTKLHPARFRQLLQAERTRRDHDGNPAYCHTCDQPLKPDGSDELSGYTTTSHTTSSAAAETE